MAFKHLLKSIVQWMERKWPDRVVVTQEDHDKLLARLKYLEAEVTKLNIAVGIGSGIPQTMQRSFAR